MHTPHDDRRGLDLFDRLSTSGLLAILRDPILPAASIATALVQAGVEYIEISLSSRDGLGMFISVRNAVNDRAVIGVGSVLHPEDLELSVAAGARFAVAPNYSRELLDAAQSLDVPLIPGALTPTEILKATTSGAKIVKVFPTDALGGPQYIRSVMAPAPHVHLLAVGGVGSHNIGEYAAAKAAGVGVGSALSTFDDLGQLTDYAATMIREWKKARARAENSDTAGRGRSHLDTEDTRSVDDPERTSGDTS